MQRRGTGPCVAPFRVSRKAGLQQPSFISQHKFLQKLDKKKLFCSPARNGAVQFQPVRVARFFLVQTYQNCKKYTK
jgi:hypothetical protein